MNKGLYYVNNRCLHCLHEILVPCETLDGQRAKPYKQPILLQ